MAKRLFAWRGVNRQGEIQNGVLHAHTSEEVSHELKQQRIRVTRIQRQFNLPSWLQLKLSLACQRVPSPNSHANSPRCCTQACLYCKPLTY